MSGLRIETDQRRINQTLDFQSVHKIQSLDAELAYSQTMRETFENDINSYPKSHKKLKKQKRKSINTRALAKSKPRFASRTEAQASFYLTIFTVAVLLCFLYIFLIHAFESIGSL